MESQLVDASFDQSAGRIEELQIDVREIGADLRITNGELRRPSARELDAMCRFSSASRGFSQVSPAMRISDLQDYKR